MGTKNGIETVNSTPNNKRLSASFNWYVTPADYEFKIRYIQIMDPDGKLPFLLGDARAENDELPGRASHQRR